MLRIAAASDLRFALDEIAAAFERLHPETRVEVSYGSSGTLAAQVANRAPFDLFLSADIAYPRQLAATLGAAGEPFVYGLGRLALWAPRRPELKVRERGLDAISDETVRRVAIANPHHAPYGRAAEQVLEAAGLLAKLKPRLVYGETVLHVAHLLEAGGADVGFVAYGLVARPERVRPDEVSLVPAHLHQPIAQGGLLLPWSAHPALAGAFREFLLGVDGQAILRRYGFEPPR